MRHAIRTSAALTVLLSSIVGSVGVSSAAAGSGAVPSSAVATAKAATATSAPLSAIARLAKKGKPKPPPKPPPFVVKPGITFTNPLNATKDDINHKINTVIQHVPRGGTIRLVSWNFDSWAYVHSLTAAHKRGVTVRLIMARTLFTAQGAGRPAKVLARNLAGFGNSHRKPANQSWLRTCSHSCRGLGGSMHAKYYSFTQSGRSKKIVMNTSANLTAAAKNVQWNDLMTVVGRDVTFRNYVQVFNEAAKDKFGGFHDFTDGNIYGWWYPLANHPDLVLTMLNNVQCSGAGNAGINGHTVIRAAQDVFNNHVGIRIASKLKELQNQGCNVKVVYSQAVGSTRPIVTSLNNNHLVSDRDGDGTWDRYLHAKDLAISGNYAGDPNGRIVLNGSANWSGTATHSDEQGMITTRPGVVKKYIAFIDDMFTIHMHSVTPTRARMIGPVNPYSEMEG